jgi:hypothetical protein
MCPPFAAMAVVRLMAMFVPKIDAASKVGVIDDPIAVAPLKKPKFAATLEVVIEVGAVLIGTGWTMYP